MKNMLLVCVLLLTILGNLGASEVKKSFQITSSTSFDKNNAKQVWGLRTMGDQPCFTRVSNDANRNRQTYTLSMLTSERCAHVAVSADGNYTAALSYDINGWPQLCMYDNNTAQAVQDRFFIIPNSGKENSNDFVCNAMACMKGMIALAFYSAQRNTQKYMTVWPGTSREWREEGGPILGMHIFGQRIKSHRILIVEKQGTIKRKSMDAVQVSTVDATPDELGEISCVAFPDQAESFYCAFATKRPKNGQHIISLWKSLVDKREINTVFATPICALSFSSDAQQWLASDGIYGVQGSSESGDQHLRFLLTANKSQLISDVGFLTNACALVRGNQSSVYVQKQNSHSKLADNIKHMYTVSQKNKALLIHDDGKLSLCRLEKEEKEQQEKKEEKQPRLKRQSSAAMQIALLRHKQHQNS